jgi:hypothetical protein
LPSCGSRLDRHPDHPEVAVAAGFSGHVDYTTGNLFRIDLTAMLPMVGKVPVQAATKTLEKVMGGFGAADGLVRDSGGRLIITDYAGHRVFVLARPAAEPPEKPLEIQVSGIESAADLTISPDGKSLLIPHFFHGYYHRPAREI